MVHHHRYYNQQKVLDKHIALEDEESQIGVHDNNNNGVSYFKRSIIRPKLLSFLFLSLLFCTLIIWRTSLLFGFPSTFSVFSEQVGSDMILNLSLCSSVSNGTICCDRSSLRTDICYMKGDIRTHKTSSSIFLYTQNDPRGVSRLWENGNEIVQQNEFQHEKIKPYTRKWETSVMNTIDELSLVVKPENQISQHKCDVVHDVPAVFFSTGGYTGNVYHEFNDGIIPLYITSHQFNKKVVFVILEYHDWWLTKYGDILSLLTDYPPIDFSRDNHTHCFPEAIVGLNIHDELTIDQSLTKGNRSIRDFRDVLDRAYWPRIRGLIQEEETEKQLAQSPSSTTSLELNDEVYKPKLVILSRNGSRAILNEDSLVKLAESIGFWVEVVKPERTTELAKIYRALNSTDVMIGVHGAAMTHFLFVKPGRVFIQVVPLGTNWAAQTYYGDPAKKLGLKYIGYDIHPRESSLYNDYDINDPVLRDPDSVNAKGWEYTKKIYLDRQNVKLDLKRFKKHLVHAYDYLGFS